MNQYMPQGLNLTVDRISHGGVPTEDASKKIYLYFASGSRTNIATKTLKQKGYDAENIGGMSSWLSAGGKNR